MPFIAHDTGKIKAGGLPDVTIAGNTVKATVTPTVSATPNYAQDDAVGGSMEFTNLVRESGGTGFLQKVVITNLSVQKPALDLVLFDQSFTASTDNAAFDPSDADLRNIVWVETILACDWKEFNDNSVAVRAIHVPFQSNGTSLFAQMVYRGSAGFDFDSTSDLQVSLVVVQD